MPAKKAAKKAAKKKAQKVFAVPAKEIAIHPALASLPTSSSLLNWLDGRQKKCNPALKEERAEQLQEQAAHWNGRLDDYKEVGILEPLVLVPADKDAGVKWWLVDGRDRFEGGQQLEITTFQAKLLAPGLSVEDFIISANCARKSFDNFQKAFFALQMCPELIAAGGGKAGRKPAAEVIADPVGKYTSFADVARRVGVSRDTVEHAAEIHRMCLAAPTRAAELRMRVFRGDGYQGIKAGDGAQNSSKGSGADRGTAWDRAAGHFTSTRDAIARDWADIEKGGESALTTVCESLTYLLNALPEALKDHAKHIAQSL